MGVIVSDSFNRANNLLTLGNADTGQTWIVPADSQIAGTPVWGIISNTAYVPVPVNKDIAFVDAGVADGTIQVTIATTGGAASDLGVVFRYVDNANFWYANIENITPSYNLWQVVAGSFNQPTTGTTTVADGDVLSVVLSGTSITFKKNGTTLNTLTDATFQTATRHGIIDATGLGLVRFDDFSVTTADGYLLVKN